MVEDPSQPSLYIGYHKPDVNHADNAVFDAITDILGRGRTSRLYKSMVKEKQIAVSASATHGFPGNKYPASLCSSPHRPEVILIKSVRRVSTPRLKG